MIAVVKISGSQYLVRPGRRLKVARLKEAPGQKIIFDEVLLATDKDKTLIGRPFVGDARVEAKVLGHGRGRKLIVLKYKSKTRYRVRRGFRPQFTEIEIEKITL